VNHSAGPWLVGCFGRRSMPGFLSGWVEAPSGV
jgi:hypothetical protein